MGVGDQVVEQFGYMFGVYWIDVYVFGVYYGQYWFDVCYDFGVVVDDYVYGGCGCIFGVVVDWCIDQFYFCCL